MWYLTTLFSCFFSWRWKRQMLGLCRSHSIVKRRSGTLSLKRIWVRAFCFQSPCERKYFPPFPLKGRIWNVISLSFMGGERVMRMRSLLTRMTCPVCLVTPCLDHSARSLFSLVFLCSVWFLLLTIASQQRNCFVLRDWVCARTYADDGKGIVALWWHCRWSGRGPAENKRVRVSVIFFYVPSSTRFHLDVIMASSSSLVSCGTKKKILPVWRLAKPTVEVLDS